MASRFLGVDSEVTAAASEESPSQEEIEREITKLKEDSAKDVERQLAEQRSAARKDRVKEEVKEVAEDLEEDIAPAWKAAEQKLENIVKDAELEVGARNVSVRDS